MGISVRAETERGEAIATVGDAFNRTKSLLPHATDTSFACLRFVDPAGDAVFNQRQIPALITELRRQLELTDNDRLRQHGREILKLVESVEGRAHTYVRFTGD